MFLIGGREEWDAIYSIIFDGKLVRGSDSWLFDSVQFDDIAVSHVAIKMMNLLLSSSCSCILVLLVLMKWAMNMNGISTV
mmetsp:Transcript_30616/g.52398  ORF Transcript_30616/g.52398 Transcript_30616/m.52398 type:complete len:80 (+) Transcript_30616:703-942(+)